MNPSTVGQAIRRLRQNHELTQHQLAAALGVTDQAVSKWERGLGCPDVSLLSPLSKLLDTSIEALLSPCSEKQKQTGGSMRSISFCFCPQCGNLISSTGETSISCCGRKLAALTAQKPDEAHRLSLEPVEDEWFLTTPHPMEKEHYISWAALVGSDQCLTVKRWPEWDFQMRIPRRGHGILYWYCTKHGLFRQII